LRLPCPDSTVAAALVLAVLLGGMPLTLGVAVQNHGPMFTLNICQPLHSFDRSPVTVLAVMPERPATLEYLCEGERCQAPVSALRLRDADAPDPPPPKARV
jgi:hypothetical protein